MENYKWQDDDFDYVEPEYDYSDMLEVGCNWVGVECDIPETEIPF